MTETALPSCAHARRCPISHTVCPGECIYADIMESVNTGVAVFDLAGPSLQFINRCGREIFARPKVEPDFELLQRLLFPPGVPLDALPPEYQGEPIQLGTRIIGFTLYSTKTIAWAFFRDITEKTRLESIAEAVETMNNLGYIFSAVRHELGNPVNSVKAGLSVLKANIDTFPRALVLEYLDRLGSELDRVEVLLRSLRNFSMYERLEPVPLDLSEFLEAFAGLARADLERRGVQLALQTLPHARVLADPRALQQALLNLVANAADALEGRADPTITLTVSFVDGLTRLTVRDNGAGMSEAEASAAFKPFHTTKAHGTGLGLVITRKLLLKMSATIHLESRAGEGTEVVVSLPQVPGEARA